MKVWITKYAFTQGIFTIEGDLTDRQSIHQHNPRGMDSFWCRGEWHATQAEAEAKVELMRQAKIKSLKTALKKITKQTVTYTDIVEINANG